MKQALWGLVMLLAGLAGPAMAVECADVTYEDRRYTACTVDPARHDLRLFHSHDGRVLGSFAAIEALPDVGRLAFAMNAGMYHANRAPVGLYIENFVQVMRLVPEAGPGNFGLLPNGVFCITATAARVLATARYQAEAPACRDATQSGPMLVIDGALHPRFLPDSRSRFLRNGVGSTAAGDRVVFVISNDPVSFHEFGRFFRDYLGLPQALYLDGKVSRLHAPGINRSDFGLPMGPIVGVVAR